MVSQDRIRHWVRLCLRCLLRLIASLLIWAFALFLLLTIADNIWGAAETDTITLSAGYTLFIILGPTALACTIWIRPVRSYVKKTRKKSPHTEYLPKPPEATSDGAGGENHPDIAHAVTFDVSNLDSIEDYQAHRQAEIDTLESKYDLSSAEGIMSIPQNASVHRGSGIQSYTGDIDYYLRRKSHDYEDAGNIDLAVLCLKKSNEIRMFCRNGYRGDDYYTLVRLLARCGRVDEARAEKEKIDRFFDTLDDETNDSYALDYSFIVRRVVNAAKSFNTDLVIMSVHGNACPECAKYQGRVFSLSGKDRRFPKIPDVFWKYGGIHPGCGHSFYPFIYGVTDGDMSYTLSVQKISNRKYAKNIVAFSNRPFVDDRPQEDIDSALQLKEKERLETEHKRYLWDHMIESEASKGVDARNFAWLQENLPDICPKSLSGYRRMKSQNTKNFQKLAAAALVRGIIL